MTERRYTESEMAEILEAATRERPRALPAGEEGSGAGAGLTLAQLQDIAREVGIDPGAVARGAAALEVRRASGLQLRRFSGVPIGASGTIPLARALTDGEWERLVARLRETFDATGTVTAQGGLREWRNGNLRVALEPAGAGARIRFQTRRSGWEALPAAGGMSVGMSLVVLLAGVVEGNVPGMLPGAAALLAMGAGAWSFGFVTLRRWARERLAQFGVLGEEAAAMAGEEG